MTQNGESGYFLCGDFNFFKGYLTTISGDDILELRYIGNRYKGG